MTINLRILFLFVPFCMNFLLGCHGPAHPLPTQTNVPDLKNPTQSQLSQGSADNELLAGNSAESLGLRVIGEGDELSNSLLPDPTLSLAAPLPLGEMTVAGNEILFHRKLFLHDPLSPNPVKRKALFLVWPEKVQESLITTATYVHRVIDINHKWSGTFHPKPVWHDSDHQRWFIPLSELFNGETDYQAENVDLNHLQVVTIELAREKNSNVLVHVKFQVAGTLPQVTLGSVELPGLPNTEEFVHETSRAGWLVKSDTITNPLPRPFHLWVRSRPSQKKTLRIFTTLKTERYESLPSEPPVAGRRYEGSSAPLEVSQIVVKHQDLTTEKFDIDSQSWQKLILQPSETLTLEWWARPQSGVLNCQIPVTHREHFTWMVHPPQTSRKEEVSDPTLVGMVLLPRLKTQWVLNPPDPPYLLSRSIDVKWVIAGGRIEGEFEREIHLAHPFLPVEEATLDINQSQFPVENLTLILNVENFDRFSGEDKSETAPAFSCQGIFR